MIAVEVVVVVVVEGVDYFNVMSVVVLIYTCGR